MQRSSDELRPSSATTLMLTPQQTLGSRMLPPDARPRTSHTSLGVRPRVNIGLRAAHPGDPRPASRTRRSALKKLEVGRPPFKSWTRPDTVFDVIDRDGSGAVARAELHGFFKGTLDAGAIEDLFATLDEDGSGEVTREEWVQGYANAGFGQGTIVGQSAEGLNVLLDLVSHHCEPPAMRTARPALTITFLL